MTKMEEICVFWFRRDLRLDDNAGLYYALKSRYKVLPVFIFDTHILNLFEKPENAQLEFIHANILRLDSELNTLNSSLLVSHSTPLEFFGNITEKYNVKAVYTNEDYELSAQQRDSSVEELLKAKDIPLFSYKDQVILSKDEVVKDNGEPYTVFTPYSKKWRQTLSDFHLQAYNCAPYYHNLFHFSNSAIPSIAELGYISRKIAFPPNKVTDELIKNYDKLRDYPWTKGTSHLGVHLRFGTISIRQLARRAKLLNDTFLNELIWREFYHCITWHFPHLAKGCSFKPKYDDIVWRNNQEEFAAWCNGQTGYPIVDAGMRELNITGYMHNRVRMITASFLTKHLLIDWRWGEAYFANKLLDFDFAANNGGWQWAAGSGCDAAPYFRIFNPRLQTQKFDKNEEYIKKWVPEINSDSYPKPIVEHEYARKRVLEAYSKALK